jgi:hypothetical protein
MLKVLRKLCQVPISLGFSPSGRPSIVRCPEIDLASRPLAIRLTPVTFRGFARIPSQKRRFPGSLRYWRARRAVLKPDIEAYVILRVIFPIEGVSAGSDIIFADSGEDIR